MSKAKVAPRFAALSNTSDVSIISKRHTSLTKPVLMLADKVRQAGHLPPVDYETPHLTEKLLGNCSRRTSLAPSPASFKNRMLAAILMTETVRPTYRKMSPRASSAKQSCRSALPLDSSSTISITCRCQFHDAPIAHRQEWSANIQSVIL